MGLILKLLSAILLTALLPGLPPYTTFPFTGFSIAPLKKLEGPLAINRQLDDVERLLEGRLYGPEALLPLGSDIYTGIYGGQIVRINETHITPMARLGGHCESLEDEQVCSRPLGLTLDTQRTNLLIAVDAYSGIWEVDLVSGDKKQLVSRDLVLDGFGVNRKPQLFNSVTVAKNGDIYWTESSSDFDLQDAVSTILANPSGRLFKYDRKSKKNTVLLDQLYFANGVALSPDEEFVLVSETFASQVRRLYLKGEKAFESDIFVSGLPGLPDNLSGDGSGLWVPLDVAADAENPLLVYLLPNVPLIRKFCARVIALARLPFHLVHRLLPNVYARRFLYSIGHFETLNFLIPPRTTVVRMDWSGRIVGSLHGSDGTSGSSATHAVHVGEFLYLGSVRNRFVGRVRLPTGLVTGEPAPIHEKIPDDAPRPKPGKLKVIRKDGEGEF
ncbi:hemomucin [Culex quinquefasciatus]|uniref:Hemomucin n=1 Tax=Culex quinquefasciatus TaxID=7176 RepID=B0X238_CULQU|nr:hemomucin [Culex quinquefasciatus]|eukprot:XP_001863710.1 hemomucin [Culex quinquefasciatus]